MSDSSAIGPASAVKSLLISASLDRFDQATVWAGLQGECDILSIFCAVAKIILIKINVTTYYLPAHAVVAAGGENNSRNRAKTPSPCLRKVEMTA